MHAARLIICVAVLLASMLPAAWAQTRSAFTGKVVDSTSAVVPGATVTLESPGLVGGTQTRTTDERGQYLFNDLPPETYALTVSLTGFQTVKRTGLQLQFGTTLTVDLTLGVGGAEETVTVEGRAPTVDVTTAQSSPTVDARLIQATPVIATPRNTADAIFNMSPGVNERSAYGGVASANEILFDGTPTTLPERQGTNAVVVNANWVEELQVVGLGASAEYGEFTGTAANFVTRSGSNQFNGLLEYRKAPGAWVGDNRGSLPPALQTRFTPAEVLTQWDTSAQIGGPILRDKLFFFAGYQYIRVNTLAAGASGPSNSTQWRGIGKLSWAPAKNFRVDATLQKNRLESTSAPQINQTPDVVSVTEEPNAVWTAKATWTPSSNTLVEFRTGGLAYQQNIDPAQGGRTGPSSRNDVVTGIRSVNFNTYRFLDQDRRSVGASLTRYAANVVGLHHELKFGVDYNHVGFLVENGFPGGASFTDRNGVPDQVILWQGDVQRASGNQLKLFAQDRWKVSSRVTLEPGVRLTINRGRTPTAGDVYSTTPVSPRFGVAWDVTPDHKTVVRAHAGRYHEAFGTIAYQFTDTAGQTPQITSRILPNGQYQELTRFTPAGNQFVDQGIEQAYMDQYLIGVQRELIGDLSVTLQYIHRDFKDCFNWIDAGSIYTPVQLRDPGPNGTLGNADDGDLLTVFNLTNPGKERRVFTNRGDRRYRGFQVVVEKRFSDNWQLLAGYTRSKAEGSVNNMQVDNYGGAVVTASPFINPNNEINATGRNTLDFTHQFIARGSYHVPVLGGFNIGGSYRYISGQALSRTAVFRLAQGNTTVRVEPRGALPTDAISQADLRLDKTFPLGKNTARQLSVYVDFFNVTNQGVALGTTEASGATFGQPSQWSSPRTVLISGRLSF
jgi:carboxypeptidase family protein/TonB-dependent receptor-like protein